MLETVDQFFMPELVKVMLTFAYLCRPQLLMLKLRQLKAQADKEKAEGKPGKKVTGAQLRVQNDVAELDSLPPTMRVEFPDKNDLMHFKMHLRPDEGLYVGGKFTFEFSINANYPIEPPKVRCVEKVYHPNIDLEGNVCLNILREDWKPILNLNAVLVGLQFLFLEPNYADPLNKDAAKSLQSNPQAFAREVYQSIRGGRIGFESFDRVI